MFQHKMASFNLSFSTMVEKITSVPFLGTEGHQPLKSYTTDIVKHCARYRQRSETI